MTTPSYSSLFAKSRQSLEHSAAFKLDVAKADSGWELVMQSGVLVACTTGISLLTLLREELAMPPDALAQIDVFMLDGKPVDDPHTAIVPQGARLALAAGLPGIAGLAMKSGSSVRGLRPGITHRNEMTAAAPCAGHIELALFSLALPLLAGYTLSRGVVILAGRLTRYLRPAIKGECFLNGEACSAETIQSRFAAAPSARVLLAVNPLTHMSDVT